MIISKTCCAKTKKKIIPVRENRRSFKIINRNQIEVNACQVDDCLIKSGKRCDHLFEFGGQVHYVELKGSSLENAVKQLEATIRKYKAKHKDKAKHAHVIIASGPSITPRSMRYIKDFKKRTGASLHIKSRAKELRI